VQGNPRLQQGWAALVVVCAEGGILSASGWTFNKSGLNSCQGKIFSVRPRCLHQLLDSTSLLSIEYGGPLPHFDTDWRSRVWSTCVIFICFDHLSDNLVITLNLLFVQAILITKCSMFPLRYESESYGREVSKAIVSRSCISSAQYQCCSSGHFRVAATE